MATTMAPPRRSHVATIARLREWCATSGTSVDVRKDPIMGGPLVSPVVQLVHRMDVAPPNRRCQRRPHQPLGIPRRAVRRLPDAITRKGSHYRGLAVRADRRVAVS